MAKDRWLFLPLPNGSICVQLLKDSGAIKGPEILPNEIGAYVAGLMLAAGDAFRQSGRPEPSPGYEGSIPAFEPSAIFLLPVGKQMGLAIRMGEAHIVLDVSGFDLTELGQTLIATSAPEGRPI